jgi:hypothetical protein
VRRERRRYKALAREVARASFGGEQPDGDWDYYERMEKYLESGRYSLSSTELLPETNDSTHNGFVWRLARENYWQNPNVAPPRGSAAYQQALEFYRQRAYGPGFQWSWRNAQLEQDLFRRSIALANDGVRRARNDLTVLIANHLLSALDAFATLRVEEIGRAPDGTLRVHMSLTGLR